MEQLLTNAKSKMQKAVENLETTLTSIRTGRANAAILEHVTFDYYGSPTPINQVASVQVVEGRQLLITPYDKGTLKDIERAISTSDTGLVPQSDGTCIRLNVPSLTEERRKELSKSAAKYGEDAKIAVRNIRRDANEAIKKNKEFTEDVKKDGQDKMQKLTDDCVKKIDTIVAEKTKEIMSV